MAGFLPPAERRSSALAAMYVALSLLLLIIGDRIPQTTLRGIGATLFAPLDGVVMAAARVAEDWRETAALHRRLTDLELENARLRSLEVENRQLRQTLELPGYRSNMLKPAEVLALTGDPFAAAATISAGSKLGVHVGDAVVTSEGLVGRIGEVWPGLSRVVLLSDPGAAVACEVESTGVLGVLKFAPTPSPRLTLTAVPFADTVRVGQRVLTSGLSRRYPRGIPVGVVSKVGLEPNGLTREVELLPAARLSRMRYVFVIPGPTSMGVGP
jgi:rod shape-determining protein MreC